jgi:hypothetical protein
MSRRKPRATFQTVCGYLAATSITVGLSADENWRLRAIAAALFLVGGIGIFVSFLVSPTFRFIGPKLVGSSLNVRITVEAICRLLMLGLTIFCVPILFYMCIDFYDLLRRGSPIKTEAIVVYVPGGAMWNWVWKDIGLQTPDGKSARHNLFFHPPYPKEGQGYEVVLLPKSECVLSFQPVE